MKNEWRVWDQTRRAMVLGAVALLTSALIGCVSSSPRSKDEPGIIALRNSTGETLASVRLEDGRPPSGGAGRLGEMAPVLPDFTYTFARSELAPPLPPRVKVQWRDASGREQSAILEISGVLKQASGGDEEALLFDIGAGGRVEARIEPAPASP